MPNTGAPLNPAFSTPPTEEACITVQRMRRSAAAFPTAKAKRKYWIILSIVIVLCVVFAGGLLVYNNPIPVGDPRFWTVAKRRTIALVAMAIVAVSQAVATVAFQTVTNNRIITPSIMGFEALYRLIHTSTIFFFGSVGLLNAATIPMFVVQIVLMVGLSMILYGWLLTGEKANMHVMLLVGIVIGGGLGSLSTFMQRLLTPQDFDILTARLFGSVNNADPSYYPIVIPLVLVASILVLANSKQLNVIALGKHAATNLGVKYRKNTIYTLVLVSILIASSTALVGPMTFLGFLVATLAYQFADTYDHKYIIPMAALIGFAVMTGAYFIMNHVFYAQGVVSIVIELVGGTMFLFVILRKGRL